MNPPTPTESPDDASSAMPPVFLKDPTPSLGNYAKGPDPYAPEPVASRISHRILVYAAQRKPHAMNQFTVEEIIKEELSRETP